MSITRRTDKGGDWTKISYVVFDAPTVKDGICGRLEAAVAAIENGRRFVLAKSLPILLTDSTDA